jgi:hypothetical protein
MAGQLCFGLAFYFQDNRISQRAFPAAGSRAQYTSHARHRRGRLCRCLAAKHRDDDALQFSSPTKFGAPASSRASAPSVAVRYKDAPAATPASMRGVFCLHHSKGSDRAVIMTRIRRHYHGEPGFFWPRISSSMMTELPKSIRCCRRGRSDPSRGRLIPRIGDKDPQRFRRRVALGLFPSMRRAPAFALASVSSAVTCHKDDPSAHSSRQAQPFVH